MTETGGRFRLEAPRTSSDRVLRGPCAGRGPGLRPRLGRSSTRRRAARRRDPPPARAGHPGQADRCQRRTGRRSRTADPAVWDASTITPRYVRRHHALGRSTSGASCLAASGHDRRTRPVHARRHRPGSHVGLGVHRPPLRPPGISGPDRRPRWAEGRHTGTPAGDNRRGPRLGRRHRPTGPARDRSSRIQPGAVQWRTRGADLQPTIRAGSWPMSRRASITTSKHFPPKASLT